MYLQNLLDQIQSDLYQNALAYRNSHITEVNNWDEFTTLLDTKTGFLSAHWDGTPETEEKIKELTKATIRCIPLNRVEEAGKCVSLEPLQKAGFSLQKHIKQLEISDLKIQI